MIRKYYTIKDASETDDDLILKRLSFASAPTLANAESNSMVLGHSNDPDRIHYFHVKDASASYNQDILNGQISFTARTEQQINSAKVELERILERELIETK